MYKKLALLVALLPAVALAQEAATPGTLNRVNRGEFETAGDVDTFTVPGLKRGNDYAIGAIYDWGLARFSVRGGPSFEDGLGDFLAGKEFRATRDGAHVIEVRHLSEDGSDPLPNTYLVWLSNDCRKGPATKCNLRPGVPQQRQITFSHDTNWFLLRFVTAGRNYELRVSGAPVNLSVRRRDGTTVARSETGSLTFQAPRGTLFAVVEGLEVDLPPSYGISLAQR